MKKVWWQRKLTWAIFLDVAIIGIFLLVSWGKITAPDWGYSTLHNIAFLVTCALGCFPICYLHFYLIEKRGDEDENKDT